MNFNALEPLHTSLHADSNSQRDAPSYCLFAARYLENVSVARASIPATKRRFPPWPSEYLIALWRTVATSLGAFADWTSVTYGRALNPWLGEPKPRK